MSKTAREVIAEKLEAQFAEPDDLLSWPQEADRFIAALDAAEFAIVPKRPNKTQEDQIPVGWSVIKICMVYARMVEAGRAKDGTD